jgi:biopolymer transport protein ExbD
VAIKLNDQYDENMALINMTPLIDIMLVLLIIFMVTSSITLESGLDIDIPKTRSQTTENENKAVIISLDNKQNIYIQGKIVAFENLSSEISKNLNDASTELVIFEGDKLATLGKTIEIMDIAKEAGAKRFAIAAE